VKALSSIAVTAILTINPLVAPRAAGFPHAPNPNFAVQSTGSALDPNNSRVHFLDRDVLVKIGRKEEGKQELTCATSMNRSQRQKSSKPSLRPAPNSLAEEHSPEKAFQRILLAISTTTKGMLTDD